jgi:hypothetical protein
LSSFFLEKQTGQFTRIYAIPFTRPDLLAACFSSLKRGKKRSGRVNSIANKPIAKFFVMHENIKMPGLLDITINQNIPSLFDPANQLIFPDKVHQR